MQICNLNKIMKRTRNVPSKFWIGTDFTQQFYIIYAIFDEIALLLRRQVILKFDENMVNAPGIFKFNFVFKLVTVV